MSLTYSIENIWANVKWNETAFCWSFGIRTQNSSNQFYITKNGKNSSSFILDADIGSGAEFILDDLHGRPATAPNIILTKFKLEKGNKATDWTPAPEDKADQSIIDNWAKDSIVSGETGIRNY